MKRTIRFLTLGLLPLLGLLLIPQIRGYSKPLAPIADLGDAPDSSNTADLPMEAYAGVPAGYPTVFQGNAPYGPRHQNDIPTFWLGAAFSAEEEADTGPDTDLDGVNNLTPATDGHDQDGADDGLVLPEQLEHCTMVTLDYTVTVTGTGESNIYLNLWLDWDRNGKWGGTSPTACLGDENGTPEWAVQNELITLTGPGSYTLQTPAFRAWNPNPDDEMWLRVTASEQPATSDNGAGPQAGYALGETEDYLLPGQVNFVFLPMTIGGSDIPLPPPSPDDLHIEEEEDPEVIASWPQIPGEEDIAFVGINELTFRLDNNSDGPRTLDIRLTFIADGTEYPLTVDPLPTIQAGTYMTDVIHYPAPPNPVKSPGVILGEVRNLNPTTGEVDSITPIEAISFHWDETTANQLVVYREAGLQQQVSDMDFVNAPAISSRLGSLIPAEESTADLTQFLFYNADDPVLAEPAVDPASEELIDIPPPPPSRQPESHNVYYLCLEWYTAPVDNGFGEDFGLNDDGWRARGARVRVWQSSVKLFDGWLNRYGCTAVYSNSTAGLYVAIIGESRLDTGSGYINLRYIFNNSTNLKSTSVWIDSPQDNAVYRPEVHYRDPVGMLSYAIQERFNGGVSGKWFYLRKAGCNNDPNKGSCSTGLNGDHIIYMSPGQWRRKFIATHEYGHKILSFVANYKNDCSFNGSGHGMTGVEFASCAAMEGWAHYVSADVWNAAHTGENPAGKFVYWDGSSTVYDVEAVGSQCYNTFYSDWLCDYYGTELDWMRHWWDFHSNDLPGDPGSPTSHAWLFDLVDDVSWQNGAWKASEALEDELSGSWDNRWRVFACWNNIAYDTCQ